MVNSPTFRSWHELRNSTWLAAIKQQMQQDLWPDECVRCRDTELVKETSVRTNAIVRHQLLNKKYPDYIIVGGMLDNICNSACQSCNASLSTKIGSLEGAAKILDNSSMLNDLPRERVIEIDLNGGEPSASPNYQRLLHNLPVNTKILRVNTNGSKLLPNIQSILDQGIHVIVTLSLDGTGPVHDYVRWPIHWTNYVAIVQHYISLQKSHTNLTVQTWTTLHALNIGDFDNIRNWSGDQGLQHDWAFLEQPGEINVRYSNRFTQPYKQMWPGRVAVDENNQSLLDCWINRQDKLRGINIYDYL